MGCGASRSRAPLKGVVMNRVLWSENNIPEISAFPDVAPAETLKMPVVPVWVQGTSGLQAEEEEGPCSSYQYYRDNNQMRSDQNSIAAGKIRATRGQRTRKRYGSRSPGSTKIPQAHGGGTRIPQAGGVENTRIPQAGGGSTRIPQRTPGSGETVRLRSSLKDASTKSDGGSRKQHRISFDSRLSSSDPKFLT